jgi:hypothetical protein
VSNERHTDLANLASAALRGPAVPCTTLDALVEQIRSYNRSLVGALQ